MLLQSEDFARQGAKTDHFPLHDAYCNHPKSGRVTDSMYGWITIRDRECESTTLPDVS
jgi:hypothetical protein